MNDLSNYDVLADALGVVDTKLQGTRADYFAELARIRGEERTKRPFVGITVLALVGFDEVTADLIEQSLAGSSVSPFHSRKVLVEALYKAILKQLPGANLLLVAVPGSGLEVHMGPEEELDVDRAGHINHTLEGVVTYAFEHPEQWTVSL